MVGSGARFTDALRESAGEQWGRVVEHKFTKELASGTIDRDGKLRARSCHAVMPQDGIGCRIMLPYFG